MGLFDLKVMTFNLRFDNPQDGENAWAYRADLAAQAILDSEAVIVGTQEALFPMLTDLKDRLPAFNWVGQGRKGGQSSEFCAIFYRTDVVRVLNHGTFWLSKTPKQIASMSWETSLPRICTWAHFQLLSDPGNQFFLFNTHLDHISQAAREQGAALIWQTLRQLSFGTGFPVILTGDMNADPENQAIRFFRGLQAINSETAELHDAFSSLREQAHEKTGATFHGFTGVHTGKPIDYIFATHNIRFVSVEIDRRQYDGGFPSDHYPVIAQLSSIS